MSYTVSLITENNALTNSKWKYYQLLNGKLDDRNISLYLEKKNVYLQIQLIHISSIQYQKISYWC
jgi:hypothetical protein